MIYVSYFSGRRFIYAPFLGLQTIGNHVRKRTSGELLNPGRAQGKFLLTFLSENRSRHILSDGVLLSGKLYTISYQFKFLRLVFLKPAESFLPLPAQWSAFSRRLEGSAEISQPCSTAVNQHIVLTAVNDILFNCNFLKQFPDLQEYF